jgi:hypothetical protein
LEDEIARGDRNEGVSIYRPEDGLLINNLTQGTTFPLPGPAFESAVKQDEIFVFCASRSLSEELRDQFNAFVCIEIFKIPTFCARVKAALPLEATVHAQRVEYYRKTEGPGPRWALPDKIATSKLDLYAKQQEFRIIFSLTDALEFEKVATRLVERHTRENPNPAEHKEYPVTACSLRDICRIHEL